MIKSFSSPYCICLWSTKINAGPPKVGTLVDRMSTNVPSAISKTGLHRCLPKEKWQVERFLFVLAPIGFLWNNLWSVSRYVMGPLSGPWRQSGNDQQCLAAPIWKYRSGFGDHRFSFFIDLLPNYTFYTNLTNIVHWVVAKRDVAHLVRLNLGKSWGKYAKSFDAGLSNTTFHPWLATGWFEWNFLWVNSNLMYLLWNYPQVMVIGSHWWKVNIGSGDGLVPSGNMQLPGPMLT